MDTVRTNVEPRKYEKECAQEQYGPWSDAWKLFQGTISRFFLTEGSHYPSTKVKRGQINTQGPCHLLAEYGGASPVIIHQPVAAQGAGYQVIEDTHPHGGEHRPVVQSLEHTGTVLVIEGTARDLDRTDGDGEAGFTNAESMVDGQLECVPEHGSLSKSRYQAQLVAEAFQDGYYAEIQQRETQNSEFKASDSARAAHSRMQYITGAPTSTKKASEGAPSSGSSTANSQEAPTSGNQTFKNASASFSRKDFIKRTPKSEHQALRSAPVSDASTTDQQKAPTSGNRTFRSAPALDSSKPYATGALPSKYRVLERPPVSDLSALYPTGAPANEHQALYSSPASYLGKPNHKYRVLESPPVSNSSAQYLQRVPASRNKESDDYAKQERTAQLEQRAPASRNKASDDYAKQEQTAQPEQRALASRNTAKLGAAKQEKNGLFAEEGVQMKLLDAPSHIFYTRTKPPSFDGVMFPAFEQQFEAACRLCGSDEISKGDLLRCALRGPTKQLLTYCGANLWTYKQLMFALRTRYSELKSTTEVKNTLYSMDKKSGQSAYDFANEINCVVLQAKFTKEEQMAMTYTTFTGGLRTTPRQQRYVEKHDHQKTWMSAVDVAAEWERNKGPLDCTCALTRPSNLSTTIKDHQSINMSQTEKTTGTTTPNELIQLQELHEKNQTTVPEVYRKFQDQQQVQPTKDTLPNNSLLLLAKRQKKKQKRGRRGGRGRYGKPRRSSNESNTDPIMGADERSKTSATLWKEQDA